MTQPEQILKNASIFFKKNRSLLEKCKLQSESTNNSQEILKEKVINSIKLNSDLIDIDLKNKLTEFFNEFEKDIENHNKKKDKVEKCQKSLDKVVFELEYRKKLMKYKNDLLKILYTMQLKKEELEKEFNEWNLNIVEWEGIIRACTKKDEINNAYKSREKCIKEKERLKTYIDPYIDNEMKIKKWIKENIDDKVKSIHIIRTPKNKAAKYFIDRSKEFKFDIVVNGSIVERLFNTIKYGQLLVFSAILIQIFFVGVVLSPNFIKNETINLYVFLIVSILMGIFFIYFSFGLTEIFFPYAYAIDKEQYLYISFGYFLFMLMFFYIIKIDSAIVIFIIWNLLFGISLILYGFFRKNGVNDDIYLVE